ncbi:MAG: alpha amylase C-terminal domain-containing protein [Deltaproteobacteria bacterium]|nr:alpha amylase C-terminal domain-containing protein [Deltaproteobacteria bacterium]
MISIDHDAIAARVHRLVARDPYLGPYAEVIGQRLRRVDEAAARLAPRGFRLSDAALAHQRYGLHRQADGWVFREWAPGAEAIFLIGDHSGWREDPRFALRRENDRGDWAIHLAPETLGHQSLYRLRVHGPAGGGDRIPAYARRVVQDPVTGIFNAQVWDPPAPYRWRNASPPRPPFPLVYEAHVGMARETGGIGTYREFADTVLPRIAAAGYNTLQLMAVAEHPYYASFGYQVSSFFAPSARFGPPEDLKALVDTAHAAGLRVLIDLVHSHMVNNTVEGIGRLDGTDHQYTPPGDRGRHPAWGSFLFDYGRVEVLRFLLSNCRYWLDEYRVDGFRFDGVTSMLYTHHGLEHVFSSYEEYFGDTVDPDALTYLGLANRLVHALRPDAVTIAEDVSGMPALAASAQEGGIGFDYRFAMGVPDYWIRLVKDTPDEQWPMGTLWHELTNRRREERTISYAESHDQALVGDQTLIFRLIGPAMYHHMGVNERHLVVDRGIALIKMIRLITLATAGHGYLNFMGNEFGHPEWIDFPREGNNWSFRHARRQWSLADDPLLRYAQVGRFDREMLALARRWHLLDGALPQLLWEHQADKTIAFQRHGLLFAFNFHPTRSHADYPLPAPAPAYRLALDSDAPRYGGHGRLAPEQTYRRPHPGRDEIKLYLPARSAVVLEPV